jgi:hypothetical protein
MRGHQAQRGYSSCIDHASGIQVRSELTSIRGQPCEQNQGVSYASPRRDSNIPQYPVADM